MKGKAGWRRRGVFGVSLVVVTGVTLWCSSGWSPVFTSKSPSGQVRPSSLKELMESATASEGYSCDIALMNLLCLEGLEADREPNRTILLKRLDQWADRIRTETARHRYRFLNDPIAFDRSEAFFRMIMMGVVLAEDFGVHYCETNRSDLVNAVMGDGFFASPGDVFITGLVGERRRGTCSSMPVLFVALGRRLDYPVKLVATKAHLFVRWDDPKDRFNIEVTNRGVNRFSDDYYRHWPFEVSDEEVQREGYLRSMDPQAELAAFLSIRGMCWLEKAERTLAQESFAAAARLDPACRSYLQIAEALSQSEGGRSAIVRR